LQKRSSTDVLGLGKVMVEKEYSRVNTIGTIQLDRLSRTDHSDEPVKAGQQMLKMTKHFASWLGIG
jgi:hypothetical protein